jgi:RNA polymerase sigma factor (sigma-70 family)
LAPRIIYIGPSILHIVEDQLWEDIRNNNQEAFAEMYKAYYQLLFATGFRISAQKDLVKDCIHELFLEIWNNRAKLPPVQHVGAYLRTYMERKVRREMLKLQQQHLQGREGELPDIEYSYEELLIGLQADDERKKKVGAAIRKLSPRQLEIIRMKFFENKSYEEISHITHTTARTVYNQVYDSLKTLRKHLLTCATPIGVAHVLNLLVFN